MKIINVVSARPNFVKIAPIMEEMKKYPQIKSFLVHTGQHYSYNMSQLFFEELNLSKPDYFLNCTNSNSSVEQISKIMIEFEKILIKEKPDLVLVVGDVNSTLACAITSVKLDIPIAHVEAGLRSFDKTMPEEINRILVDSISDYLFVTESSAEVNLLNEGIPIEKIHFVGNVMIDTLLKLEGKAQKSTILEDLALENEPYAVLTLHRPSNVDNEKIFKNILETLNELGKYLTIVYPVHPRVKEKFYSNNILLIPNPLGYLDFLKLMSNAKLVLTDSGGIQEETTVLGVPCLTLRENTERPATIREGTNILVGLQKQDIIRETLKILNGEIKEFYIPMNWDGKTSERIVKILLQNKGI